MTKIYLVHYHPPSHEPFKNIMRLSKEDAFALADKLFQDKTCSATVRFGPDNFASYYADRVRAEEWLYDNFTARGGKPVNKHPIYFYVHGNDIADDAWPIDVRLTKKIPLADVDAADICFTFGDTCERLNKPDRMPVIFKDELLALLKQHGSIENLLAFVKEQIGYSMIEAHIWDDKYVMEGMS